MRKITKRSAVIGTVAVVAVGGAGAAFAAWSLSSSEDVSSTAGSAAPLVVSSKSVVGTLVPGSINSVQFFAHNPNDFPVKISNITYSDVSTDSGHSGCGGGNLQQISGATLPGNVDFSKAGDAGDNQTINYANSIRLIPDPASACQGAQFTFKINLTVASTS
jgi:hypothetical protein